MKKTITRGVLISIGWVALNFLEVYMVRTEVVSTRIAALIDVAYLIVSSGWLVWEN